MFVFQTHAARRAAELEIEDGGVVRGRAGGVRARGRVPAAVELARVGAHRISFRGFVTAPIKRSCATAVDVAA
jgi:hypothetical protein